MVGKAADGEEALKLVTLLKPDVITLDLEMPRMDGFTFLRILMAQGADAGHRRQQLLAARERLQGARARRARLRAQARAARPRGDRGARGDPAEGAARALAAAVVRPDRRSSAGRRAGPSRPTGTPASWDEPSAVDRRGRTARRRQVVAIASSTGGPSALLHIFGKLPATTPAAFVVAQHMPDKFTRTFAERLDKRGPVKTVEATDGDVGGAWRRLRVPRAQVHGARADDGAS